MASSQIIELSDLPRTIADEAGVFDGRDGR